MLQFTFAHTLTCPAFTSGPIRDTTGIVVPYAVTPTPNMLPPGRYRLSLIYDAAGRRGLSITPAEASSSSPEGGGWVGAGHSFRTAKGTPAIIIGEELIPGAVISGRIYYDRLIDRIEKAEQRGDPIELLITHALVRQRPTPRHWRAPAHHYLPPTPIQVKATEQGEVTVYNKTTPIRHYPPK